MLCTWPSPTLNTHLLNPNRCASHGVGVAMLEDMATYHTDELRQRHLQTDSHPLAVIGCWTDELVVTIVPKQPAHQTLLSALANTTWRSHTHTHLCVTSMLVSDVKVFSMLWNTCASSTGLVVTQLIYTAQDFSQHKAYSIVYP